jgi:hypothetical protein
MLVFAMGVEGKKVLRKKKRCRIEKKEKLVKFIVVDPSEVEYSKGGVLDTFDTWKLLEKQSRVCLL